MVMSTFRKLRGSTVRRVGTKTLEEDTNARKLADRTNAALASWLIVAIISPFWFIQFFFWAASLAGLGVESLPLVGYILPGETVFVTFTLFGIVLGILFWFVAISIFLIRGVDISSDWKGPVFSVLFACSLFPGTWVGLFFIIPWVFVYCFCIVFLQTGKGDEV